MEDGTVIVPGEHGATTVQLPPFTLIAATTEPGKVLAPLRNRFAFAGHIEGYPADDLAQLLLLHCETAGIKLDVDAALVIATASRNTPRLAINNLHKVRTYSDEVTEDLDARLDAETAEQGLEYNGIDKYGLDDRDRRVLTTLVDTFRGGPIGLNPFSSTLGVSTAELTADIEPYLIQAGLLTLRGRGRCATRASYLVLGKTVPPMLNGWR
jgi:Holliday junction DNA helicase RuvB